MVIAIAHNAHYDPLGDISKHLNITGGVYKYLGIKQCDLSVSKYLGVYKLL